MRFILAILLVALAVPAFADTPDPAALQAYQKFSTTHPGWQPTWKPNGPAWSLIRKQHIPGSYGKTISIEQTVPTRVNNARDMLLLDPTVIDPFVSASLGEIFNFSVTADFKLVNGIQPLTNQSYLKHDHPLDFWFETSVIFTAPDGSQFEGGTYPNALGQGAYCTSGPEKNCIFASQPLNSYHQLPLEAPTLDGIWQYSADISLVQRTPGGQIVVIYTSNAAGAFLVDNTTPEVQLVDPAPDAILTYPVGIKQFSFSFGDPGIYPSGVDINSINVTVAGYYAYLTQVTSGTFVAELDLTGLEGEIPVTASLVDRAGNFTSLTWTIRIEKTTSPILAAHNFLEQVAPTLGIQDIASVALEVTYVTESPEPAFPAAYTVRFEQIGPGNLPVEGSGLTVDVLETGEVVGVSSAYHTELQSYGPPTYNFLEDAAKSVAVTKALELGASVEVTKVTVNTARWILREDGTFAPVWPVRVWVDAMKPYVISVNLENGVVERTMLDMTNDFTITGQWFFPATSSFQQDPAKYKLIDSGFADIYFHLGYQEASPFFSESNKLRNYYVVQSGDASVEANGAGPYASDPWSLEAEVINTMVWTARLNSMTNNVSSLKQSEFAHVWWRQTSDTTPCSAGGVACAFLDGPGGTGLEYYYEVGAFYGANNSPDAGKSTGFGADPKTVVHETTHGILFAANVNTPNNYASAFHEGFAQANECLAFGDCVAIESSAQDYTGTDGNKYYWRDNWGLTNDPHDAGLLLTGALQDLHRRLNFYSATYKQSKGFDAAWGIPNRLWTGSSDPQLGRTATYLKQGLSAGRLPGLFLSQFDSEILFSYTMAYMPIGNKVSERPDTQKTVAWRFVNLPFSGLVGPNNKEQAIEVVGFKGTSYKLRFYLTDPTGPYPFECTEYPLASAAYAIGNVPNLGYATFGGAAVGEAIQACKDTNFFLFGYRNCAPMKIFIVAEAISNGQVMARTTDRTDVLGYMPYVQYQGSPDKCACYNDCGGCRNASAPINPQDTGKAMSLVALPLGYLILRRMRRRN